MIATNLRKRGIKFSYEPFKLAYFLRKRGAICLDCGSKNCRERHSYTPDFVLGNGVVVEAKGRFTSVMRTKMREVVAENPDKDIRMLFQRNQFMTKKKKHTYGEWCDKQGITWAEGKRVPEEWCK